MKTGIGYETYMEQIYTQQEAEKAKADAEFVLNFAEALSVKLKGNL